MDLPKRIKQHKAESDSYAILLYKLRNIGIFRNLTNNDYGIDFEIEFIENERATGNYVKAQVKSSENLKLRKRDYVPTVSGIKQSTLNYWAELSYKSHVIAYAVDLKSENIYLTTPIFWQSIRLLDDSNKSKTIEFIPHKEDYKDVIPRVFTILHGKSPSLLDEIYSHKTALKNLKEFFRLYADIYHYDLHMPVEELDTFETFLEVCRVLLWPHNIKYSNLTEAETEYLFSLNYWKRQTANDGCEEVANYIARKPMKALMPYLINALIMYEKRVFESKYYWKHKNISYLKLVYSRPIPDTIEHEKLLDLGYNDNYKTSRNDGGFEFFLSS